MEQGLIEHDIPDMVVHAISENLLVVEIGQQKFNLSRLSVMILVRQLSHALNRNAEPKRSWLWKRRMKRLVKRKDGITESMLVRRRLLQDDAHIYNCFGDRRNFGAVLAALEYRKSVVMREIHEMEMES